MNAWATKVPAKDGRNSVQQENSKNRNSAYRANVDEERYDLVIAADLCQE
jgi:hypothetical protein